ncbi:TPA: hypothetical protein ACGO77_000124 [Streptococcus suis]
MAQLIASNQLTLTNLKEKAIDRTEISFWHGLSATKHPLGVYDCSSRDHYFGNEFNVTSGEIYTVRVIAKQTKGSIRLAGGIWYTAMTSGYAWDSYAAFTLVGEASEDGLCVYERKFVVASGKTKAKIYIQIEQGHSDGSTAWRIYDGQVFDENNQPLITDQNKYSALTSPMASPDGTYIWKRTVMYYTDSTSNTIWEYSGVGAKGEKGDQGIQGIPGVKGADGKTQYTHIAYADTESGGGFSQTDQTKSYIGMYQDFTATNSTNPSSYKWTKWRGTDGSQGIPGPKGDDGKTPYIHFAYADNADGTGLTVTDNGQRYMGHYSDYTQADSTDKTKYRWADRWAKIEVGGENIVDKTGDPFVMGYGITNTTWNPETKRTRLTFGAGVELATNSEILPKGGIFESQNIIIQKNQTYTQAIRIATDATFLGIGDLRFTWYGPEVANSSAIYHRYYLASIRKIGVNEYLIWSTVTWDRPDIKLRPFDIMHLHTALDFRNSGTFLEFYQPKLETGTVPTAYSISNNDRDAQIDSKADQALTQQQLNLLIEKAQLMQTELEAKVAMETLSDLERAYNAYVEANDKAVAKSEADLIEAGRRVDGIVETLGGLSKTKKFIETYITEADEGIVIGTNDNVSQIRVTYDRIAMYSAGKEVMYISQGVINIDNGVFTKSLQIGRFRTEQHPTNLDINVCRYLG